MTNPIDPRTKAELTDACVNGILELMASKPDTMMDGTEEYSYQFTMAARDLAETNQALREQLIMVVDPDIRYVTAFEGADAGLAETGPEIIEQMKIWGATDVILAYARASAEVRAI